MTTSLINSQSSIQPQQAYLDRGYNFDFSNGYQPSVKIDTSQAAYLAHLGMKNNGWNRFFEASGNNIANWRNEEDAIYNQYLATYKTNYDNLYNSPVEDVQRQVAAGYNPYYLSGANTPASNGVMSSMPQSSPSEMANVSLNERNQAFDFISQGISSIFDIINMIANTKKNLASAKASEELLEPKKYNLTEQGFSKWLNNNINMYSQFQSKYINGVSPLSLKSAQSSGIYIEPDSTGYARRGLEARNSSQELQNRKLFELLEGGIVQTQLNFLNNMKKIREFDANMAEEMGKYIYSHFIPAILSGEEYKKATKDFYKQPWVIKSKFGVELAGDALQGISEIISSIAKMKGVAVQESADALKWLLETGEIR